MKYYVLSEDDDDTNAYVEGEAPEGVKKMYELKRGISRAKGWPSEAPFSFSPDRPEGINANDFVQNSFNLLIISDVLKRLLESEKASDIEFLPVQLLDHKNRLVKKKFWIANSLKLTEVVDRKASKFEVDAADESKIAGFQKLVLKRQIADAGPPILRMQELVTTILVRESLVKKIQAAGLTGMKFTDTESFTT